MNDDMIEKYEAEMEEQWDEYCEHLQREEDEALIIDDGEFKIVCWADPESGPEFDSWTIEGVRSGHTYYWLDLDDIHECAGVLEMMTQRTSELKEKKG